MMRNDPTKQQVKDDTRDTIIASLENKEIPLPTLPMIPLPGPIVASAPHMEIMKKIKERHDYLTELECFFRVLENAFVDPSSSTMEKQNEAELILKTAYETGGANEKQFYEVAVLAGYCKNISLTETEWDSIKENTIARIESGDSNAEINFITVILYNNIKWATQEDTLLALGLLWHSAIDEGSATKERCVNAQYVLGELFWKGLAEVVDNNLWYAIYWLRKAKHHDKNDKEVASLLDTCKASRRPEHFYHVRSNPINGFDKETFDTGKILGIKKINSIYDKHSERSSLFSKYKDRTISAMFDKPQRGARESSRRKIS